MTMELEKGAVVHAAGPADGIPVGEGRSVQVGERRIAIFRARTGEVFALQAECPHLGGPLEDGITGSGRVTCPLHGFVFELATGQPVGNGCHALRTYPVHVTDAGEVMVTVTDPTANTLVPA